MAIGTATAILGAAAIGAGASALSSSKAAKTAKNAAQQNNQLQQQIYSQNAATLSPFVQQGGTATNAINQLLGLSTISDGGQAQQGFQNFLNTDGYNFRFSEGARAVQSALGARGLLNSGAAAKSLLKYGQGVASDEFGRYLGYLTGQQGVGLTAASAQAGVGQNFANATSANNNLAANNVGNAALATGNAVNNALGSAVSAYSLNSALGSSYGGAAPPYIPSANRLSALTPYVSNTSPIGNSMIDPNSLRFG